MVAQLLVVEDDPSVAKLLRHHLERAGYHVRAASTIGEARELIREPWDLALLDRNLPDGNGLELCRELRTLCPHAYLIMLTGESSAEAKLDGFAHGADDYITKPFQPEELLARIRAGVRIVELQKALLDSNRRLEELSLTDALTGLRNRRAFDERLRESFEHSRRYARPLSLVLADVDHFKAINDAYGHPAGDAVLRGIAHAIAAASRQADFVARIGGEEFAFLLPETPIFEAIQFCEKIRATAACTPIAIDGASLNVTVSLGMASFPYTAARTPSELFEAADQALYRAKANGRNRAEMERRREARLTPRRPERLSQQT